MPANTKGKNGRLKTRGGERTHINITFLSGISKWFINTLLLLLCVCIVNQNPFFCPVFLWFLSFCFKYIILYIYLKFNLFFKSYNCISRGEKKKYTIVHLCLINRDAIIFVPFFALNILNFNGFKMYIEYTQYYSYIHKL